MSSAEHPSAEPARRASAVWANRRERSNLATLRLMAWISLRLGRPAGRVVLHLITAYFLLFAPAARRASAAYLRRVYRRRPHLAERYRHIFSFAATIHDRVYLLRDRFDLFELKLQGEQVVGEMLASGRGALLFGAHLGSFEVIRALARRHTGLRVVLAMYEDNARKLATIFDAINPANRPEVIALGHVDAMLKVRDRLDQGALVGILADRSLGQEPALELPFLGAPAPFPLGPWRLAAMLRCPVIFMAGLYLGANRYAIRFEALADFSDLAAGERDAAIRRAVERYAGLVADCCREAPYNWFNFFDFWSAEGAGKAAR